MCCLMFKYLQNSRLMVFFFKHFKDVAPLSWALYCTQREIACDSYPVPLHVICFFLLFNLHFKKIFALSWVLSNLILRMVKLSSRFLCSGFFGRPKITHRKTQRVHLSPSVCILFSMVVRTSDAA